MSKLDEGVANGRPVMQLSRVEVSAIRPHDGLDLGIESDLPKEIWIGKRTVKCTQEHRSKVDRLTRAVAKVEL